MSVEHIWKQKSGTSGFWKKFCTQSLVKNIVTELDCSVTELLNNEQKTTFLVFLTEIDELP